MGFGKVVATCYRKYAVFSGRARRSEYWFFALLWLPVGIVTGIVEAVSKLTDSGRMHLNETELITLAVVSVIMSIFAIGSLLPTLAVSVRRLHDLNASGWWLLLFIALQSLPLLGILSTLALLAWFSTRGTAGDNRFGPDPLGGSWEEQGPDQALSMD